MMTGSATVARSAASKADEETVARTGTKAAKAEKCALIDTPSRAPTERAMDIARPVSGLASDA
jgi:alpha-D-ribose 1-methylphosphonate 5-triphosphate synthase subunit PhnG